MSVYDRIAELRITLPPLTAPVAAFVLFKKTGEFVFLSGHIAKRDGKPWVGQLGAQIEMKEGKQSARAVAIDLLGTLKAATQNLDNVRSIVKLTILVNSSPSFTAQHLVANDASELLQEVFGDAGPHTRTAFGVAQVPFGACVEIDLIAEVK